MSQYIVYSARNSSGGGSSGVSSLNGQTGTLTLLAGSNITITPGSGSLTIASTASGSGTVTSVSVVTANGISGTVATATTTPAITLTLGAITPSSVNASGTVLGSNLSGTNTGDLTIGTANGLSLSAQVLSLSLSSGSTVGALSSADWNTFNGKQVAGSYITALTGDAAASGPGSAALTLATVNGNVGSFGDSSHTSSFTVNAKGLITAASNTSIQIAEAQVINLVSDLAGKQPTGNYITALTGDVSASGPGSSIATISNLSRSKLASGTAFRILANDSFGVMSEAPALTDGQLLIGSSGAASVAANLTAGSGVTITPGAGSISISATGLGGTVTSVALTAPSILSIAGSPITTSGTLALTLANQSSNTVFASPSNGSSGSPLFRSLVSADIPSLSYLPLTGGTMSGAIDMGSNQIHSLLDPTSAQDAATKNYVDSLVNGLTWKQAAHLATIAVLPANTYNNGASGVGATLTATSNGALSVDSVAVSVNDRVLVKNEATSANNGIYVVTATGNAGAPYVLTRSSDFNSSATIAQGDAIYVSAGSTLAGTAWALTPAGPFTVGTTALTFGQAAGPGSITAGTGISISGTTVSLITPVVVSNGGTNSVAALNNNRVMQSSGGAIVEAAAITAARALISDANGIPTQSVTTSAELALVSGVTSSIQTQLNAKQSTTLTNTHILVGNVSNVATDVPLSGDATLGNTGALTLATVNGNVGAFGDAANVSAITVNAKGLVTAAASTSIQIAESQVTNLISDLAGKQPTGNYITATTGDVVAAGPGSVSATVQTNVISNAKLAQAPTLTIKGNNTGGTANVLDLTVSQVNTMLGDILANGTVAFTAAQSMGGFKLINVLDPTAAQDAATKNYVDTQLAQLNPLDAVYAATAGSNIAGTYLNGVGGVGATFTTTATGTFTVDGVAPPLNSRVLIKNQSSSFQNGVYNLTTAGSLGVSAVFTRALDFDTASDMNAGSPIPILNGTVNAGSSYYQTATITTVGTDALVFAVFTLPSSSYLQVANNLSDVASKTTSFNNLSPMTTTGDLIIGGTSGAGTRLGISTPGYVLTVVSGAPAWAPATGGGGAAAWASETGMTYAGIVPASSSVYSRKDSADDYQARGTMTLSSVNGSTASVILPSGIVIDSSKMPNGSFGTMVGHIVYHSPGSTNIYANANVYILFYDGSTTDRLFLAYRIDGSGNYIKELGNALFSGTAMIDYDFSVAIV